MGVDEEAKVERLLDQAAMHMHGGQLGRAISAAREAIDMMQRMDTERPQ